MLIYLSGKKKLISLTKFLFSSVIFFNIFGCENLERADDQVLHLFVYKEKYILRLLDNSGYSDFDINEASRNWSGSSIYLQNFYRDDGGSIILSVSRKGIKKLIPPAKIAYLNDKGEFVAWFDDIKKGIHFSNGYVRACPMDFTVDPSGQYFLIQIEPMHVEIASVDQPEKTLFKAKLNAEKIYTKEGKIYLFARNYQNVRGPGDYEQHEIICQIFSKTGPKFEMEEEIHIERPAPRPSPFSVVDFDPWSDKILVVDVRDVPFSFLTAWYLFDLKTKRLTFFGRERGYAFFLKEDILGSLLKRQSGS